VKHEEVIQTVKEERNILHTVKSRAVESESWSRSRKEFLGGVGVGKNVPTPTSV
jgi:hypothetical protein